MLDSRGVGRPRRLTQRRSKTSDADHATCWSPAVEDSGRTYRGFGRSSLMFVTPAWAQTSSLSPPGDPPTPSAATISSPTLIATAPGSSAMSGSVPSAGPAGFLAASAAKALEASNLKIGPKVTTVYALRKADVVVPMVEWSPLAWSLMTPEGSTTTAETG